MSDDRDPDNGERGRLFAVARKATGPVPAARRDALRAGILAASAASAVTVTASAAAATPSAAAATPSAAATGITAAHVAGATAGEASVVVGTSIGVGLKTVLGGLVGMVIGGAIVGTATVLEPTRSPAVVSTSAPAARPPALVPGDPPSSPPVVAPDSSVLPPLALAPADPYLPPLGGGAAGRPRDNTSRPAETVEPVSPEPPQPVPTPAGSSLTEETAALREVSRALAEGKTDEALKLLDRPVAGNELGEERLAARIVALCKGGQRDQAAPLRAAFFAEFPRSTQRDRIERACVPPPGQVRIPPP